MRQFWLAFTGALCLLCSGVVFALTAGERVSIAGLESKGTLSVRSCAGTSCTVVTRLPNDSKGMIISGGDFIDGYSWYQIQWDSGATGWSAGNYLTALGSDKRTAPTSSSVATDSTCQLRFTSPHATVVTPYQGECLNGYANGKGTVTLGAQGTPDIDVYVGMFAAGYGTGQMRVVRNGSTLLYEGIMRNWTMHTGTEYVYGYESTRRITYSNGVVTSDTTGDRNKYEATVAAYKRANQDKIDKEISERFAQIDQQTKNRFALQDAQIKAELLQRDRAMQAELARRDQENDAQTRRTWMQTEAATREQFARVDRETKERFALQDAQNKQNAGQIGKPSQGTSYQYDPRQHQTQPQPTVVPPSITTVPMYGNNGSTISTPPTAQNSTMPVGVSGSLSVPAALPPPVSNVAVVNTNAPKPSAGTGTMSPSVGTGQSVSTLPPPTLGGSNVNPPISSLPPPISNSGAIATNGAAFNSALTYDKVLTASEMAWNNGLPYSQRATTQFSPAQISQIKADGRWGAWVAQTNAAIAKPAQPVANTQNAAAVGLTDIDRRWISGLPVTLQSQINSISPTQINHLKASGNWERLKTATSQAAAEIQNAEAEEIQGKIQIWTKAWNNFQTTIEVGSLALGVGELVEFTRAYKAAKVMSRSIPAISTVMTEKELIEKGIYEMQKGMYREIAGTGTGTPIYDIDRVLRAYGGKVKDWKKVVSKNWYEGANGKQNQIHAYLNTETNLIADVKLVSK